MTKEPENNNSNCSPSLDELIDDMQNGNYKHIQIFLYKDEPNHGFGMGEKYLVVNHNGFGLYRLKSVDYNDGTIQLVFINPATGNPATVNLDIKNVHPDLFVINWKDITDMVYADQTDAIDELLELDED